MRFLASQSNIKKKVYNNKSPFKVLQRIFGCKFNDGIYLGWRVRRAFRSPFIQDIIKSIRDKSNSLSLDFALGYSNDSDIKQESLNIRRMKANLIQLIDNLVHPLKNKKKMGQHSQTQS